MKNRTRLPLYVAHVTALILVTGCEEIVDPNCDTMDPLNELEWIAEMTHQVDESCNSIHVSLFQATYKRRTVFYVQITDPQASVAFYAELYNCGGDLIRKFENSEQEEFYDKVTNRKVIYSCHSEQ